MKCGKCNRIVGYDHLAMLRASAEPAPRVIKYICPRCGHREEREMERRRRSIPVDIDRRAVAV